MIPARLCRRAGRRPPAGAVTDCSTPKEVFENEQVRHLEMAWPVNHPALGELLLQAPPVVLSRTPGSVRLPAPDACQHTDEILGELGYSREEIRALGPA
jgi:crotonobetainyl-CoA:carnitine CoA-transferase CaiB-like acyl-CoA transferase